jgi:hypothetical protein
MDVHGILTSLGGFSVAGTMDRYEFYAAGMVNVCVIQSLWKRLDLAPTSRARNEEWNGNVCTNEK